ncbi:FHA domain-containing protein [Brassicibacter mesophilus]|uniref:FHA domain-containing protein n=1 Tax=Brassicibacter mesophilus TaxID=745119 RepID=UPI003D1B690D
MFNILSLLFRYLFILLIYLFMVGIIRMIYLDIKSMSGSTSDNGTYLKLLNRKDTLPFKIKEVYNVEDESSIGRGNQNEIVIRDPYISKAHAKIVLDECQYFLEDLNSANGTFLNGTKILDAVKLSNGDRIKLGQIEFIFVHQD